MGNLLNGEREQITPGGWVIIDRKTNTSTPNLEKIFFQRSERTKLIL